MVAGVVTGMPSSGRGLAVVAVGTNGSESINSSVEKCAQMSVN
jgi:hypothetical protein